MYFLLPFKFRAIEDNEVLVNEPGNYLIVPRGTAKRIVERKILNDDALYKDLIAGWFISDKPIPDLIDNLAVRLRTKKAFLSEFTSLHIFVSRKTPHHHICKYSSPQRRIPPCSSWRSSSPPPCCIRR